MLDRHQVLAFRADGHNLASRLPRSELLTALGAAGIRNARGSGLLALHARIEGVDPDLLSDALETGVAVDVISARGTDTLVPRGDIATFTLGTVPADEESLRARLKPFLPVLDRSGRTATDALEAAKAVARRVLATGPVDIGALSGALTRALPDLSPLCRGRCNVAHIEQGLFDLVGESGLWRHEQLDGSRVYVSMKEPVARERARADLVRRYLRCYGPSTAGQLAEWCGIGVRDAARSLTSAGTSEVDKGRFLLTDDLARFESASRPTGVRILAPRDPYLLDRDRATLVPDRVSQKRIWRATPTDGVILAAGQPVATWRPQKTGRRLRLNVEPFAKLARATNDELEREAAGVARLRNCTSAEVVLL